MQLDNISTKAGHTVTVFTVVIVETEKRNFKAEFLNAVIVDIASY
jgi:hypothetical protein